MILLLSYDLCPPPECVLIIPCTFILDKVREKQYDTEFAALSIRLKELCQACLLKFEGMMAAFFDLGCFQGEMAQKRY
jgi:hypothetical protein